MFKFANPEYLYLFLLAPVFIGGFIALNILKKKDVLKLGEIALVKRMMPELSLKRSYLRFWIVLTALGFGIIMIARPQFGTKVEQVDKQGIELVIAIDVSNSMLAEDVKPNRLKRAKQMLTRIINERRNDKIAIVVFAGEAFIQLPLTADTQSAKIFLESINPSLVPVQGTVIGSAIDIGMTCFTNDKEVDRAMILITDGESHDGNAEAMAKKAAEAGVRVNVMGIGSTHGAPVPVQEGASQMRTDSEGNIVMSRLNEDMAKKIAEAGKGIYTPVDNTNRALNDITKVLDELKKHDIEGVAYSEYDEKFYIFAWIMLALLLLDVLIFDKKNRIFRNIRLFK